MSFAELDAEWTRMAGGKASKSVTLTGVRDNWPVMGNPTVKAAQTIRYEKYPGGAPFPAWWFAILIGTMAWGIYDGGKGHWGTSPISKSWLWIFDAFLVLAVLGMGLDTLVTVNGTYINYGTVKGLEHNGHLRQWAGFVKENLGINFAWAMVLTDVLEGMILLISWYYGRKERNLVSLVSMFALGGAHWFSGFATWDKGIWETLQGLPLFLKQLGGTSREFQGGGPQTVVGVV